MTEPARSTDRKLRILHVLRAPLGGLFRHVLDLTREQIARGHEVGLVVDSTTCGESAATNLALLEPALALGILRIPIVRNPHVKDIAGIWKVHAHARRLKVDVIHGHGSKGGLYARAPGLWQRHETAIRCYTPHGGSFNHIAPSLIQGIYMGVERRLAKVSDILLFESVFIANRFRERVGDTSAMVRIVQNGISAAEFERVDPAPDAADLLYIGELRAAKGIDTLIDALAILSRKGDQRPRLVLVGSGPDKLKLKQQARLRGVTDQILFVGAIPARRAFTRGKILVVPSRAESLPYIVLEAAGAQIPMIATDVGGIGEVFGPYKDRLIQPDDAALLAATIKNVMATDPATLRQQVEELKTFVASRFSISIMSDSVIAGYRDAIAKRNAGMCEIEPSFALPT